MMELRKTGLDVPLVNVDCCVVPVALLDEAKKLARREGRFYFVGVLEEKNPDYVEPKRTMFEDLLRVASPLPTGLGNGSRWRMTGEFILTDDRAQVQTRCGRIVWVSPRE